MDDIQTRQLQIDTRTNAIKKSNAGAPTKYTSDQEIVDKAIEYLEKYEEQGDLVPNIQGLALHMNVRRETIWQWVTNGNVGLSNVVSTMKNLQGRRLLHGGLSGTYNASIAKMLLTHHGYTDKSETSGSQVSITINRGSGESVTVSTGGQTINLDDLPE